LKKIIFTILFAIQFALIIYCADINANECISNDKHNFYYSINGVVNDGNFLKKDKDDDRPNSIRYYNKWLTIWQDSLKTSGLNYIGPISIHLPDSISLKLFNIKKDNYVVNFKNSRIEFIDKINGFYVRISDDLWSEYHINTETNKNCTGFNIILNSIHYAKFLNDEIRIDTLSLESESYENKIIANFLKNKDNLRKQLSHNKIININKNDEELKNEIRDLFSYQYLRTNLNNDNEKDFIIIGTNNDYKYHTFIAVVLEGKNSIIIKTHSHFKQVIKINSDYFLLLHHYIPHTGCCVYSFYRVGENDLIQIWSDSSSSR